jgi:Arc/MetJ-type ribon-helix-helix transcriptional regulator
MITQRTPLNVSLAPELERFITARAASGRCQTASEAVPAGLHSPQQSERGAGRAPRRQTGGARPASRKERC